MIHDVNMYTNGNMNGFISFGFIACNRLAMIGAYCLILAFKKNINKNYVIVKMRTNYEHIELV